MNRPEGISESAWDAASELLYAVDAMPSDGNITIIAKALQSSVEAERLRCANVADEFYVTEYSGWDVACEYPLKRLSDDGKHIAAAIRKGA